MEKKIAQGSIEFLILTGVIVLFLTLFFLAIQEGNAERFNDEKRIYVQNVAFSIQDELNIALKSSNGYMRRFEIPEKILGLDYEAELTENVIYVELTENVIYVKTFDGKHAIALPITNVTGQIVKGTNLIKKENNTVFINP